jgi:pimeloyl-ACP methyl ester carboxylesterase
MPAVVSIPALGSNVLTVTIDAMADDLHALLNPSGVAPSYIIAGHSMGGMVARRFQSRCPGDVAGMLLADSSHEDQSRRLGDAGAWDPHGRYPTSW